MNILSSLSSSTRAWKVIAIAAVLAWTGCIEGCERTAEEEPGEEAALQEVAPRELGDDLVAVVRLQNFSERHFDLRHWRQIARESGQLKDRGDQSQNITAMPTAQFRLFAEELLGEERHRVQWNGHMDIAIWAPEEPQGTWRWAVTLPRMEGESLEEAAGWPALDRRRLKGEGGGVFTLYQRPSTVGEADHYYVAEIPLSPSEGSQARGSAVGIANFEEGLSALGEAVGHTGLSGRREGELYLWPRRWGVADRYTVAAELMEQHMAMNAHDLLPARTSLLQLQTQIYRAMGNEDAWPDMVRLSLHSNRSGPGEPASRVEFGVDIPTMTGNLLPAVWRGMRETNLRSGPQIQDAVGQVGMILRPRDMHVFANAVLPEPWLQLMSVRGAGTRSLLIQEFQEVLLHNRGPTTVGFYEHHRPLTGEVFIGWQVLDREMLPAVLNRFLNRLLRDYWMPLHDVRQMARQETRTETFADEEVEIHEMTFVVHGTGEVGVCWTIRGSELLSYFGAQPCERLRAVAERPERSAAGPALVYTGRLQSLLDKLFVLPGDSMGDLLEDVHVQLWAQRFAQGRIGVTAEFTDLGAVAQIADELPRLRRNWAPGAMFEPELFLMRLALSQATYQEPGLAAMMTPGMTGVMPTSFLLGMPFAFPPTSPSLFRRVYLDDPEVDQDHDDHAH